MTAVVVCGSARPGVPQGSEPAPQAVPPSNKTASIGYATVADAFAALHARTDVVIVVRDGWTIVQEQEGRIIWSFVPTEHHAFPAVVRREFAQRNDASLIQMQCLCESTKAACDRLVAEFEALNAKLRQSVERK